MSHVPACTSRWTTVFASSAMVLYADRVSGYCKRCRIDGRTKLHHPAIYCYFKIDPSGSMPHHASRLWQGSNGDLASGACKRGLLSMSGPLHIREKGCIALQVR
jgi:hypothetical protein